MRIKTIDWSIRINIFPIESRQEKKWTVLYVLASKRTWDKPRNHLSPIGMEEWILWKRLLSAWKATKSPRYHLKTRRKPSEPYFLKTKKNTKRKTSRSQAFTRRHSNRSDDELNFIPIKIIHMILHCLSILASNLFSSMLLNMANKLSSLLGSSSFYS